jgi:hypothetical protein
MASKNPKSREMGRIIERIGYWTLALTALGAVFTAIRGEWPFALSFLLGGGAAWIGYRAHVQLVDRAILQQKSRWLKTKFFLRYGLIILAVYGIIRSSYFDPAGFFTGLLLPAAAIVAESIWYLFKGFRGT